VNVKAARYDGLAAWYEAFRPALSADEADALERLRGRGDGRCLDVGCGTGVAFDPLRRLGWSVVGTDVSEDLLEVAREGGLDAVLAPAESLPFPDATFDAAVSIWTHTDVEDFGAVLRELARVLRPEAPFVYIGAHPCFVGPHSRFIGAEGVPELHEGYRRTGRYNGGPAISPEGLARGSAQGTSRWVYSSRASWTPASRSRRSRSWAHASSRTSSRFVAFAEQVTVRYDGLAPA
jgi:SAM-dependent methyltransferase